MSIGQGINITSGGEIEVSGTATIEINNGDFINDGTYTKATETVTFSGASAKVISGTTNTDFYNLNVTNTGGITTQMGELTANNITVNAGAGFTVDAGKACNVINGLTNSGTFNILSDATSNGSLIVSGTSSGNVIYKRYMSGNSWHLVSSPVGGSDINGSFMTANSIATNAGKYGLAPYDNSTPAWQHYTIDPAPSGSFVAAKGYEIMRSSDGTVSFTGTISTSNVGIGISKSTSGWNLVGNPFPSAINGNSPANATNNFLAVNLAGLDASYGAIYIWNAAGSAYLTVNHTSDAFYIAPGQAFFVNSKTGGSTMNFTEAMQTHQTGNIFKNGDIPSPSIKLIAERKEGVTSTNIIFMDGMTTGLDPGYDAGRFTGGNNSFAVYTHLVGDSTNSVDFDIQCLPANQFNNIIPAGLNAPANAEIVFRTETTNLPSNVPVYLEDRVNGTFTNLTRAGSIYTVKLSSQSQGTGRFFIHTSSALTATDKLFDKEGVTIIPIPQNNSLHITGAIDNNSRIAVYDMAGRKLIDRKLEASEVNDVEMEGLISGFYVVFVSSSNQNVNKKISWIRND